ncbi:hypothetical protein [Bacillus sp. BP-3]|uniref:hypothetical protein n=1 Tax=Bacillus sp. BP-3 TaxID=3022773 RepID=UPI00232CB53A|nr:hypothetical protein [Bacillus sp. BP-3]MDC2867746.1 hypothetical protein [Bacillus sp. BP-3]
MLNIIGFAVSLVIISTLLTVSVFVVLKNKWNYLFILIPLIFIIVIAIVDMDTFLGTVNSLFTPIKLEE